MELGLNVRMVLNLNHILLFENRKLKLAAKLAEITIQGKKTYALMCNK